MIKAVIDTNVLVSGLWSHDSTSPTRRILSALLADQFEFLLNDEIVAEYEDVLNRKKFGFNKVDVATLISHIKLIGKSISPHHSSENFVDPDDEIFYEVALADPDALLVTGNLKHFPVSPIVVTPTQFCYLLGI